MIARRKVLGFGFAMMAASSVTSSAEAQRVSADIHIGTGPVAGTIRIGDRPYYRDYGYYGRPRRREVVVAYPSRVYVEKRHGWNAHKHRNARTVVVYYDRQCGLYFDRYRHGLEETRVLYDDNRYYWYDDYRDGRDDRYRYDRRGRHDRDYGDRDRGRYDKDQRNRDRDDRGRDDRGRYERRDDDRNHRGEWEHDH